MYDKVLETKKNKIETKDKIETRRNKGKQGEQGKNWNIGSIRKQRE